MQTWHAPREDGPREYSKKYVDQLHGRNQPTSPTHNKRRLTFSLFKPSRFTVTPATEDAVPMSPTRRSRPLLE